MLPRTLLLLAEVPLGPGFSNALRRICSLTSCCHERAPHHLRVLYASYLVWQAHSRQHNLLLNMEKGTNTAMLPGGGGGENYGTDGGNA